jgi:hypothetical protein
MEQKMNISGKLLGKITNIQPIILIRIYYNFLILHLLLSKNNLIIVNLDKYIL